MEKKLKVRFRKLLGQSKLFFYVAKYWALNPKGGRKRQPHKVQLQKETLHWKSTKSGLGVWKNLFQF